jgi:hypothetical protein
MMPDCTFAALPGAGPCRGQLQRAHWVSKERLRRYCPDVDVWDPVLWTPACEYHHHAYDRKMLRAPDSMVPDDLRAFLTERGVDWMLRLHFDREPIVPLTGGALADARAADMQAARDGFNPNP